MTFMKSSVANAIATDSMKTENEFKGKMREKIIQIIHNPNEFMQHSKILFILH